MSGQVLLARVVDGAGREVHHCPLPAPAPALICNGGHPSHSGYRTCWLTYNTHVFHSRLQPNQKSFILSAHDMSIHLLFTIHESKSQHHTIYCRHWDCEMERICRLETAAEAGHVTRVHRTRGLETGDCSGGGTSDTCPPDTWTGDCRPSLTLVLGPRVLGH